MDPESRREETASRQAGATGGWIGTFLHPPIAGQCPFSIYDERTNAPERAVDTIRDGPEAPDDRGAVPPAHARDRTGEPGPQGPLPAKRFPDRPAATLSPGLPERVPIGPGGSRFRLRGVFGDLLPPPRQRNPAGSRGPPLHLEERGALDPFPQARGEGDLRCPGDRLHPGTGMGDARLHETEDPGGRNPARCEPVYALDGPVRGNLRQSGAPERERW